MITSKQRSLIGLAAVFAIASIQACGSDPAAPSTPAAGAPGAGGHSAGAPAAGAPAAGASAAGASAAGAPAAGAPAGGTGGSAAGAPAGGGGSGGASAGSGGSSAGAAGKGGGGAAGGGSTATFAQVTTIINTSCATGACHNSSSMQINFKTPSPDLYTVLTTPIPTTGVMHCKGTTLVVPSDTAGSFLVSVVTGPGMSTCKNSGANEMIARMPDACTTATCLSAAQIKTISDWIAAGAPH